jgi:hypothetical protein
MLRFYAMALLLATVNAAPIYFSEREAEDKVSEGRGASNYSRVKAVETLNVAAESFTAHTAAQEAADENEQSLENTRGSRAKNDRLYALYHSRSHESDSLAEEDAEPSAANELPFQAKPYQLTQLFNYTTVAEIWQEWFVLIIVLRIKES